MTSWIAITGATGFIGKAICRRLHASGYRIRILARSAQRAQSLGDNVDSVVAGDLHDPVALRELVTGTQAVIHCAGVVRGATQADFDRVNVTGVQNLLDAMLDTPQQPSLFYLSSLAAREPTLSFYANSKHRSERLLADKGADLRWLALRPPAVYGPGDRELLPLFRLMSKGFAPLLGEREARFSMIYVDDIATLVEAWLAGGASVGGVFSLDDGKPGGYSWSDVSRAVEQLCQRPVKQVTVPAPLLAVPAWINRTLARCFGYAPMLTPEKLRELRHPDWVCDNRALQEALDWRPQFQLAQGLAQTPGWCARLD